jgi:hypothetical protein
MPLRKEEDGPLQREGRRAGSDHFIPVALLDIEVTGEAHEEGIPVHLEGPRPDGKDDVVKRESRHEITVEKRKMVDDQNAGTRYGLKPFRPKTDKRGNNNDETVAGASGAAWCRDPTGYELQMIKQKAKFQRQSRRHQRVEDEVQQARYIRCSF